MPISDYIRQMLGMQAPAPQGNQLPGGNYKNDYPMLYAAQPELEQTNRIGDMAGTMTRNRGVPASADLGMNDLRAYTPQEAQKAQAGVDAQSMRERGNQVAAKYGSWRRK